MLKSNHNMPHVLGQYEDVHSTQKGPSQEQSQEEANHHIIMQPYH